MTCNPPSDSLYAYHIVKVKTFPENKKGVSGTMKIVRVKGDKTAVGNDALSVCKLTFERTSEVDPVEAGCP